MIQNLKKNSKVYCNKIIGYWQVYIGALFSVCLGLSFISCLWNMLGPRKITSFGQTLVIFLLFLLFAYNLNRGLKRIRLNKVYEAYIQQFNESSYFSVERLATTLKMPINIVETEMQTLVYKGFIDSINLELSSQHEKSKKTEELVFNSNTMPNLNTMSNSNVVKEQKEEEYVEVTCKNCGASKQILKGTSVNCEYCGSLMSN